MTFHLPTIPKTGSSLNESFIIIQSKLGMRGIYLYGPRHPYHAQPTLSPIHLLLLGSIQYLGNYAHVKSYSNAHCLRIDIQATQRYAKKLPQRLPSWSGAPMPCIAHLSPILVFPPRNTIVSRQDYVIQCLLITFSYMSIPSFDMPQWKLGSNLFKALIKFCCQQKACLVPTFA